VTLTLRRPDPSLLSALALPFGDVLPRGTPASDQSEARIASAGPYRVASYAPGSAITLVRNPGYAPGAAGPAEPGPETIRVRLGVGASAGLSAVIDGSADYVQDRPSAGDLRRARAARSAVRVRRHVEGATYYFFMNTRRAPFDDVRVRTAVSAAIDRAALARAFGGEAVPTAQVLPPFVPGRRRIDPAPTPDPARARELVRRAGAAGAAVSVWGWSSEPSATVTRMLARTLAGIGLRPRTRLWDRAAMLAALADPAAPSQIGFARWQQDYPEGGDWFPLLLSREAIRPAGTLNYALLDDPALDDLIDRTAAAWDPAARAAGWADVGRAVARRAPWAPFANPVRADVVSRRVRGYVASPLYGFLWMRARVARS
jgi:peptide/nickel transport system substrate-binding protein